MKNAAAMPSPILSNHRLLDLLPALEVAYQAVLATASLRDEIARMWEVQTGLDRNSVEFEAVSRSFSSSMEYLEATDKAASLSVWSLLTRLKAAVASEAHEATSLAASHASLSTRAAQRAADLTKMLDEREAA